MKYILIIIIVFIGYVGYVGFEKNKVLEAIDYLTPVETIVNSATTAQIQSVIDELNIKVNRGDASVVDAILAIQDLLKDDGQVKDTSLKGQQDLTTALNNATQSNKLAMPELKYNLNKYGIKISDKKNVQSLNPYTKTVKNHDLQLKNMNDVELCTKGINWINSDVEIRRRGINCGVKDSNKTIVASKPETKTYTSTISSPKITNTITQEDGVAPRHEQTLRNAIKFYWKKTAYYVKPNGEGWLFYKDEGLINPQKVDQLDPYWTKRLNAELNRR